MLIKRHFYLINYIDNLFNSWRNRMITKLKTGLLFILPLIFFNSFIGSELKLEPSEKIVDTKVYPSFVTTVSRNNNSGNSKIDIFSKSGEKIFEKRFLQSKVKFFSINPDNESGIYIVSTDKKLDNIVSFDFKKGNEKWTVTSSALSYEMSENGKYLITNISIMDGRNTPFEIINAETGEKVFSEKFNISFYAKWLDNENIVFAFQEYEKLINPKYIELDEIKKEKSELVHQSQLLFIKHKRQELTDSDYTEQRGILDDQINKNENKRMQLTKKYKNEDVSKVKKTSNNRLAGYRKPATFRKNLYKFLPTKLKIFNINSNTFVKENNIFNGRNEPLYIGNIYQPHFLNVDKNKNVYIMGKKNNNERYDAYLLKIDDELSLDWEYHINHPFNLITVEGKNELYFGFKNDQDQYYFINDSKQKIKPEQMIGDGIIPADTEIKSLFNRGRNTFRTNDTYIDKRNDKIIIDENQEIKE